MVKETNTRFSITLDRELKADLAMIAFETGYSLSSLISMAMTEFVNKWKELEDESGN